MVPLLAPQLAALALCGADVLVRGIRLRLLVPGAHELSLWRAITINAYGDAASAITPGRLGGDPARFVGFRRVGVDATRAIAGLAVEALIDWVLLAVAVVILGLVLADTAAAGARHLVTLATGPTARLLVAVVLVLVAVSAWAARRYRRRIPPGATQSLAAAWQRARQLGWRAATLAATLTAVSMALRTAILPVLAAAHLGPDAAAVGSLILGSFALLYGQLLLPVPAGAGAVELGFVGGFAGTLSPGALAALLVAWRVYTLIVPAGLGALLLAGAALPATNRRYRASSSGKVRSQR